MSEKSVIITLKKSTIGARPEHTKVLRSLGLRKTGASRKHVLTPVIQGMIRKVDFMLKIEDV